MAQESPRARATFAGDRGFQRSALEELRRERLDQVAELSRTSVGEDDLTAPRLSALRGIVAEVEAALARLDDGTYGLCGRCEVPIPPERLEVMPHARYCVACQQSVRQG